VQCSKGVDWPATVNVSVVSMVLCEGLLKDSAPHRRVFSDSVEVSGPLVLLSFCIPNLFDWKPVINDHSVRHTEGVEVHTVDTCLVECSVRVHED